MGRKNVSAIIQRNTLINSRRRCAVCYGLFRDENVKTGQIAHVDGDNTNNSPENLLFLCLTHHDLYDTKTSQSKNITQKELEFLEMSYMKI
ncbi:HNH endonuclease [Clostridium sp. YIM B02555]|uniref:HNH endonuclease n=1 Tax=Clostridium sp. YIM B02555 TaxID=2911968 RepID=UPI001EEDADD6|nr:HNH endonuclease [Clostridium sp. YIM B02555]